MVSAGHVLGTRRRRLGPASASAYELAELAVVRRDLGEVWVHGAVIRPVIAKLSYPHVATPNAAQVDARDLEVLADPANTPLLHDEVKPRRESRLFQSAIVHPSHLAFVRTYQTRKT